MIQKLRPYLFTLFLLSGFASLPLWGQIQYCIDFESVEQGFYGPNNGYNAGDFFFSQYEVDVSFAEFLYFDNSTDFFGVGITDDPIIGDQIEGQYATPGNANLYFDFTTTNQNVVNVCFDFVDLGGEVNLGVNGQDVVVYNDFTNAPNEVAPGVTLELDLNNTDFQSGTVCLIGTIENLTVGGQEFGLDNICFVPIGAPECQITEVIVEPHPCTPNGIFYVDIEVHANNPGNDGFTVRGNGVVYGSYSYDEQFITIGPLAGDGETPYEFVVIDNQNEECRLAYDLGPIDCEGGSCVIDELQAYTLNCVDDHVYNILVNFFPVNVTNDFFDLYLNGELYDFYSYEDLPLVVEEYELSPNSNGIVVKVCDNDNPDCCRTVEVEVFPCSNEGCIGFEYAQESQYGTSSNTLPGELFYFEQEVDFSLDSLHFDEGSPAYEYVVIRHANNDPGFNFEAAVAQYLYNDGISTVIDFTGYTADVHTVTMDFIHNGGVYNLSVNGQDLIIESGFLESGTYDLGNGVTLEVVITETTDDFVQGTLTFTIEDGNIETLLIGGTGLGIDNLCLNPVCELGEMIVEAGDCNDDGQFSIFIDFAYQHTVADSFALRLNGELYDRFAYADLPIEIGPFEGPTEVLEFKAFDIEWDGCFTTGHLEPINCNCPTFNFELVENPFCLNGGYAFSFFLGVEGEHGEGFTVTNSEGISFEFPYSNTGIYEGGFDGLYDTDVITICDNAFPDCCIEVELHPNCGGSDCEFSNMEWFMTDCDDSGNFYIKVDFDFNFLSAGFLLYVNEELYQDFNLGDLPLEIGPFDGDGETAYVVGIQLADPNANCYIQETFGPVDCDTGSGCGISEVIVEPYDCNDGQFMVDLAFESQNTGPLGYYVFVSGQIFGPFSYNEPYVTIGPLAGDGETFYNFTILDIADPACFGFYELGTYDCNQECGIYDLVVEAQECNPDGTYEIVIDFEYQNPGNNFFDVYDANGEIIGYYPLGELPVTIENFAGNGGTVDFLQVCINDQPNCCTTTSFAAPDCTGDPCQITEVFAEAYDCENGTFLIDLVVSAENPGEHGYTVLGNGQIYGTFEYSSTFITLGPFEGDGETVYEFIVVDNDNETCTNYTEIGPIDCPDCQISDLEYSVDCHSGPFFTLHLDFNYQSPESDYFDLKIGDQFIDEFLYSALPLTIELPLEMGMGETLTVCDHEFDNCCTTVDFFLPCCSIRDMVVEAHDCDDDGTFYVDLDFIHGNTGNFFTLVYGPENGDLISEVYSFEDLPLTVGPFDGDNSSSWYFQATDESLFCQTSTTLDPVYCDNESCLEFEDFSGTFFGPNTGYNVGDEIGEENGILMTYETFPGDECNCYVFVVDANTFPAFNGGTGHIIALFNSGIGFDFTTANQVLSSITFDYYFNGTEVKISVNGADPVVASSPEELPSDIAPGVTLMVDPENGTMTFTGEIETLIIYGAGNFLLDNGCFETTTPEPVDVWPGDANLDNIASHYDLLNIGVAYEATGPARNNNTIEWAPLAAEQWEEEFANGTNFKHADCNGDGVINEDDREAILQNYGQEHGTPETITPLPATDLDPAIFLDAPEEVPNSLVFEIPVILGTEDIPVEDIYGIAFEIEVDANLIDLASLEVEYPVSWLGEPNVNLISLDRKNLDEGTLEIAMVRTDHNNVSGFGPIVILRGIIDDIAGIHETEIRTNAIKAISVSEEQLPLRHPAAMLTINNTTNDPIGKIDLMRNLRVYPNPTSGMVHIDIKYQLPIEQVDILDPTGKQVAPSVYNQNEVSMDALPAGMYMLKIHLGGYVITERVVKAIR